MKYYEVQSKIKTMTDEQLLSQTRLLVSREKQYTALMIIHLAEIARRRSHLDQGYGSLFEYCTSALRLSEGSAWLRIQVARSCGQFPDLLSYIANGWITLTVAGKLAPHLRQGQNQDKGREILRKCRGASKRQVEEMLASLRRKAEVCSGMRRAQSRGLSGTGNSLQLFAGSVTEEESEVRKDSPAPLQRRRR